MRGRGPGMAEKPRHAPNSPLPRAQGKSIAPGARPSAATTSVAMAR